MAFKSILTVATGPEGLAPVLRAASRLALAEDGHLDVLAIGVDAMQPALYGYGDSVAVMQIGLDNAREAAAATEAAAKALLMQEDAALRWSVESGAAQYGTLRGLAAQRARFSDLVVLARPYGTIHPQEAEAVLDAALFDAQAPVLILPPGFSRDQPYSRIVVAWNQSREAMAAVRRALPFLKAAGQVNVVVIDPPAHGAERSDPGGMLCQMLVRHGVHAEVSVLAKTEPRVADVLSRHIRDQAADLLVMGAYGHSRLREAILGGATRHMLESATLPMLLAH